MAQPKDKWREIVTAMKLVISQAEHSVTFHRMWQISWDTYGQAEEG